MRKDFTEFFKEYVEVAIEYNERILDGVKGLLDIIEPWKSPTDISADIEEYVYSKYDEETDGNLIEDLLEIANECFMEAMGADETQDFTANDGPPISWN